MIVSTQIKLYYCALRGWLFSVGADGTFVWSEVASGNKLGNFTLPSKPRCFQEMFIYESSDNFRQIRIN